MSGLRHALAQREHLVGMQCFTGNPIMVEIMGYAGFDWVCVDLEHAPSDLRQVEAAVRAARATGMMAVVRVPEIDPVLIAKVLDLGLDGLVVPHFETADDAKAVMDAVYYPPKGKRGACSSVNGAHYGLVPWAEHCVAENERLSIIPLLESAKAFENLDELLALPDDFPAFWVGSRDLAQHLNVPGADLMTPELQALCEPLFAKAASHGKALMATVSPHLTMEYAEALKSLGFRMLSFGTEETVFAKRCKEIARLGSGQSA